MEHTSKRFTRVLDSVRVPIQHFIDTGIFDDNCLGAVDWSLDISPSQVRRACRKVASELKRPFIQMSEQIDRYHHVPDETKPNPYGGYYSKLVELPEPRWARAYLSIPKRKYLTVLASPLLLAGSREHDAPVYDRSTPGLWNFTIFDHQFWLEYQSFILHDPACRAARKLPVTA